MTKSGTAADLLAALLNATRPVTFVVGSALVQPARPGGPGVPGVPEFARLALSYLRALPGGAGSAESELSRLATGSASAADTYQVALSALAVAAGQDHVAKVVQAAVLHARAVANPTDATRLAAVEADSNGWALTPGAVALGRLLARSIDGKTGVVLTTNFDPLIEVAVRRAGGDAVAISLDADGSPRVVPSTATAVHVVHLHGFWRETDTLHTDLTAARPKLESYLRGLLATNQFAVLAYGGWDDVLTRTLALVSEIDSQAPQVIWGVFDSAADPSTLCPVALRGKCDELQRRHRLVFYGGIDCHVLLPALDASWPASAPTPITTVSTSPPAVPPGWEVIRAEELDDRRRDLTSEDVGLYLDGDRPQWHHVLDDRVKCRAIVGDLVSHVARRLDAASPHALLLVGPGGEGKTTALLQAASRLLKESKGARLLWRSDPIADLPATGLRALESGTWIIVADEAENLADAVRHVLDARDIDADHRVFILLAARDSDWFANRGNRRNWGPRFSMIRMPSLTREDASVVESLWAAAGDRGLGALASTRDADARSRRLLAAAMAVSRERHQGSLLGASLRLRFTPEGLRDRVASILERQLSAGATEKDESFRTLACVYASDAIGLEGCDRNALCEVVGIDEWTLHSSVFPRLGSEVHAARAGSLIRCRHPEIASAAVHVIEGRFQETINLKDVYSSLTRVAATSIASTYGPRRDWLASAAHAPPKIFKWLRASSIGLGEDRASEIALAAAQSAVDADPVHLVQRTTLANTFRAVGQATDARLTLTNALDEVATFSDRMRGEAGAWLELAVVLGDMFHLLPESLVLASISLSDQVPSGVASQPARSLEVAGKAFELLLDTDSDGRWGKALRAVSILGPSLRGTGLIRHFVRYAGVSDRLGVLVPRDRRIALQWLREGILLADDRVSDRWVRSAINRIQPTLDGLRKMLLQAK